MHRRRDSAIPVLLGVLFVVTTSCVLCDKSHDRNARPSNRRSTEHVDDRTFASGSRRTNDAVLPAMTEISNEADPSLRHSIDSTDPAGSDLPNSAPLRTVPAVDLERYMGRWFEIARLPNRYQTGVVGVIAEYDLQADGEIVVRNYGRSGALDAELTVSTATAWVSDKSSNAKWLVQFIWPFKADYWIIDLDDEYRFAVVGQPDRERLWILSRTSTLPRQTLEAIFRRLKANGYDTSRIQMTPQRPTE
ncbi:MAG: lipocalin family protein [Phycisphaerales bacterium]|nr:lipocalin family protein [Phycisphaerales bacterium]MCB9858567.1 lipocalin family protein [Phycisphaerales bacterium]